MFSKGLLLKPKVLYARYAELCGLMLKHAETVRMSTGRSSPHDAISLLLPTVLTNLQLAYTKKGAAINDRGLVRFLDTLQIVALHFPAIVDLPLLSKVCCM